MEVEQRLAVGNERAVLLGVDLGVGLNSWRVVSRGYGFPDTSAKSPLVEQQAPARPTATSP
jgi:hypothetical protein